MNSIATATLVFSALSAAPGPEYTEVPCKVDSTPGKQDVVELEMLEPTGAQVSIWYGDKLAHSDTVPMTYIGNNEVYFGIQTVLPDGRKFRCKVKPALHHRNVVRMGGAAEKAAPAAAPTPAPAAQGAGMPEADFNALVAAVKKGPFSADRSRAVELAAAKHTFTCKQIATLLGAFSFSKDQLQALELVKTRIVDRENLPLVYAAFTFETDRRTAQKILAN